MRSPHPARAIEDLLGRNLPRTFKGIDRFLDGVATSIKSMHLGSKTYQDPAKIISKGQKYVNQVADFNGARMGAIDIKAEQITGRALRLGVPPGATEAQKSALKSLVEYGKHKGVKVEVITVP
jgi:filamentous hemagglutinin